MGFILRQIPNAVLSWRLTVIREVIFSGFQLDLYTSEERAFAYFYVAQTIEKHISCLEQLIGIVPAGLCECGLSSRLVLIVSCR